MTDCLVTTKDVIVRGREGKGRGGDGWTRREGRSLACPSSTAYQRLLVEAAQLMSSVVEANLGVMGVQSHSIMSTIVEVGLRTAYLGLLWFMMLCALVRAGIPRTLYLFSVLLLSFFSLNHQP